MPGLYTAIFGENEHAVTLLTWLGLRRRNLGRYRDAFKAGENVIGIYCRLGGNNRAEYQDVIDRVRHSLYYIDDRDDSFDNTYLTFFMTCPPEHREAFARLPIEPDRDTAWATAIERLETAGADETAALAKRVDENTLAYTSDGRMGPPSEILKNVFSPTDVVGVTDSEDTT